MSAASARRRFGQTVLNVITFWPFLNDHRRMTSDPVYLSVILVASAVGFGFFRYGRKQQRLMFTLCGIGLMGYPYVVSGVLALVLVGVAISAAPFFIDL